MTRFATDRARFSITLGSLLTCALIFGTGFLLRSSVKSRDEEERRERQSKTMMLTNLAEKVDTLKDSIDMIASSKLGTSNRAYATDLLPSVAIAAQDMDWCGLLISGKGKKDTLGTHHLTRTGPLKPVRYGSGRSVDGNARWFSQDGQDTLLWEDHFQYLGRRGAYLDVATNDPVTISNTYFYDKCLGWKGICVEANKRYFEGIKQHRGCHLVPTCVSDKREKVVFRLDRMKSGIEATNKNNLGSEEGATTLECITLAEVMNNTHVMVIDYLSLDVEGHELRILKGLDWRKTKINVMTVETKSGSPVDMYLKSIGYREYMAGKKSPSWHSNSDKIYFAPDVVIGKPT